VFVISGGDFITFDGINAAATANTIEFGYLVRNSSATNGATNNTIRNARISLDRTYNGTVGLLQSSSAATTAGALGGGGFTATSSAGANVSNSYSGLVIENAYRGIHLLTASTSIYDANTSVSGCTIGADIATVPGGDIGNGVATITAGIQAVRQNNLTLTNNTVRNLTVATTGYGISVESTYGACTVAGNRIYDIRNISTTSTTIIYGLRLDVANIGTGHSILAYNNMVSGITHGFAGTASATVRTIGIITNLTTSTVAGTSIGLYYNSVRLQNLPSYTASSAVFVQNLNTGPVLTLRNNIFADFSPAQTGVAKHVAINSETATQFGPAGSTSDYNDLYVANAAAGENGYVGLGGTTSRATLADWQAAVSQDANSVSADPSFTSPSNLHASGAAINNAGTPVASVTVDIDGETRHASTPDIGADEFTPVADDVEVVSITAPATPAAAGLNTVSVSIRNNGGGPLNTVQLQYVLNGGAAVVQNFTIAGGLASAQVTTLSFTTQASLLAGVNSLTVTGSLPNGSADPTAGNNSATATVYTPLAGAYTINKLAAAGPTNFVSFTAAATALNAAGVSAAVQLNVLNGPYNEQFALGVIAGVSSTRTIVVDGGASKQTLTYTAVSTQPAAILLNGSQYITINNLTIDVAAGATYGIGVLLVGQANFNRVTNSVIKAPAASTSTTANAGIAISGGVTSGTSAGSATDLWVENNVISGGYNGIIATGAAATILTGIRIAGNTITDSYLYGIDLEYTDGATVSGNDISRPTRASFSTFAGVYFTGTALNAYVFRNRIHDPTTATPTSTSATYGVYFSAADGTPGNGNQVINNLIYNFNGAGVQYGIYSTGSDYGQYYHNTISLDNTASTATAVAYGLYQTTAADGVEFRNNIVSVTRGGSGNRAALNFNTATSNITSDYNDLYLGTGANFFTGLFSAATYATLADWKTANGGIYDQHSLQTNPRFVAGTLVPNSGVLNGTGDPALLALVPQDFASVSRNNPPDPGAYEFTPVTNDVAVLNLTSPAAPFGIGSAPVTVTVQNVGGGTTTEVTLTYVYNGGAPITQTFTGLSLTAGQSTTLTFTTPVTVVAGSAPFTVVATLPNGAADDDPSNNTLNTTLRTALSGLYTINDQAAASATNFVSFTTAAAALNQGGISAAVQFDVLNGPYTEQISLGEIAGTSATDTVFFNGNGRTIRFGSTDVTKKAVIQLNGSDYVTIHNLVINANHTGATYGWGVHLTNGADHNRVSSSTITTGQTTVVANFNGIVASATINDPSSNGNNANDARLENNTISGGVYGILLSGANAAGLAAASRITGNTVQDFYTYGILTEFQNGTLVKGNDISRPTRTPLSTFYGVYMTGCQGMDVESNLIHAPFTAIPTSTSAAYGVYISASDGTPGNETDVVNNVIYGFNGTGTEYGFYNSSSDYVRYYHNTVSLDNTAVTATAATAGFYQTGIASGIEFVNNVVSVTRNPTGAGDKNALDFSTNTSSIYSDYNDLYLGSGTDFFTGSFGTAGFATLADWKTANSGSYDQHSVQANPFFVTGSRRPSAAALDGSGTTATLARVPKDVENVSRTSPPDMGAYEFTPAVEDIAVVSISAPVTPAATGLNTITAIIRNNGLNILTEVTLAYTVNGGTVVTQTFTGLSVASGATAALSFTTQGLLVAGGNALGVTGSLPNGNPDSNPANNTATATVYAALAGTYTINKLLPTGGTNFVSFTAAATALNLGGISASVRFDVLNGPYSEQFALGIIPGVSDTDTIVVDGGASKQTLTYTATSAQPAAVLLNGSDYVTINNLTIDVAAGATYGIGVLLVGQANFNRVSNSVIKAPAAATSSTANAGIAASGGVTSGTSAGDANALRIENNVISGGYYGIILTGASTSNRSTEIRVTGNEIKDFYTYGLDVENSNGAQLLGNDIHRATRTATMTTFNGIYQTGNINTAIERNRIHAPFTGNTASTSAAYGIYFTANDATAGNENDVVNNVIYGFNGSGVEYGLYNVGSDYARYYHNTISLDNTGVTSASATTGFYQTTAATGIDFRNNVVSVTRNPSGAGDKNAVDFGTTTSTIISNYNDLYIGSGTDFFTGSFGTTGFATLANWKTANGNAYDQNSLQVNPNFVSPAGGNFQPGVLALDGAGTTATLARVPRDIAGLSRNSPPDPGAYEFTLVATDLAPTALTAPLASQTCLSTTETVSVTVRNQGLSALNFATNPATVTVSVTGPVTATLTGSISTGSLAVGATRTVVLTPTLDMSALGTYTFAITATVAGDQDTSNDLLTPSPTVTVVAPVAGSLSPGTISACVSGTTTLTLAGAANGSIQYQQSTDNVTFTDILGANSATYVTPTVTQTTYYRAQTRCSGRTATSNVATFTVSNPQVSSTNSPLQVCPNTAATLTATAATGTIQFYDVATGGTALAGSSQVGTTATYTTGPLAANTTFYVERTAITGGTGTAGRNAPPSVSSYTLRAGLVFNATAPFTLQSVTVYSGRATTSTIIVDLQNSAGTILTTSGPINLAAGSTSVLISQVVPLNFSVPAGTGMRLVTRDLSGTTSYSLVRESGLGGYPYGSTDGNVSITNGMLTDDPASTSYYYFYNWQVSTLSSCTGTRTPLQVNLAPLPTFSTTQTNACFGGTGSITVTAADGTGSFEYSSNGGSTWQVSNVFTGLAPATYSILVRNLGGTQCVAAAAQSVTITAPAAALAVSATKTDATSFGGNDGTITAAGADGTAPYQYSIDGGTTFLPATPTTTAYVFTGLTAGGYTVLVRDANACTSTTTITVGSPAAPADLVVSTTQTGISGTYNNVTVTGTGNATLGGALTVNGTLTVQAGGTLNTSCQLVSGPGAFVLNAGATLAICSPAGISSSGASGAIQLGGTRTFSPQATYHYNGTGAQQTGTGLPSQVRGLVITADTAGVSLTQPVQIAQVLSLQQGVFNLNGQGLTLLSGAAGTALVTGTGRTTGTTATVQRYIDPSLNPGLGYRHYSAPVTGSTVADLTTPTGFAPVVNAAYNTAATPGTVTPFPTVYGYDETRLRPVGSGGSPATTGSAFDKGWFSPTSLASPLAVGSGYTVNIRANQLVDFNGTLVNGDQNLTGLSRGAEADAGWQFLGNPFPAPIDWTQLTPADFTNVDNAMYVYKSNGQYTGSYTSFVNGVGGVQDIATAQGFFVRTSTPGTGSLRLRNAIRKTTYASTPTFNRGAGTRPLVQLELSGAATTDAAYVYFEQGSSASAEARFDAVKLPNTHGLNLSSTVAAAGVNLAINGLPLLRTEAVVVPLHIGVPVTGTYTLTAAELVNFTAGTVVELRDAVTGAVRVLQPQSRYSFTMAAGAAGTRFTLVFRPGAVTASRNTLDAALVSLYPNPAHGRFTLEVPAVSGVATVQTTLLNALGQVVAQRKLALNAGSGATAEYSTASLAPGVYMLQVRAGELLVTKRVVVE
jgi:parallel beta-helix repeat protein